MTTSSTITTNAQGIDQHNEIAALEAVVAAVQVAQESAQIDDFIAQFNPDVLWVTGFGTVIIGRDQLEAFSRETLPGWNAAMPNSRVTYQVQHVAFLRPDVAAVAIRQQVVHLDGSPDTDQPEGRPTYVMTKDAGTWRIACAQNTHVVEHWHPDDKH